MDLKQVKLSKSEWDSIEIPVSDKEKEVLSLITKGYTDVNIKINRTDSLFTYLKIEFNGEIEEFLFSKYFGDKIKGFIKKYNLTSCIFFICKYNNNIFISYFNLNIKISIINLKLN